jgi:DNA-binding NarL/FixJ family response regulator
MSTPFATAETTVRPRTRVLVIDDDPVFRCRLVAVLRRDYLVAVATEGADGYRKATENPPDLAVIDLHVPGWDGLQTLQAIRADEALARVRTVILTSDASRETVLAAIRAGADDFIIKTSFSREEFLQKVELLLPKSESVPARHTSNAGRRAVADSASPAVAPSTIGHNPPVRLATVGPTPIPPGANLSGDLQDLIDTWE